MTAQGLEEFGGERGFISSRDDVAVELRGVFAQREVEASGFGDSGAFKGFDIFLAIDRVEGGLDIGRRYALGREVELDLMDAPSGESGFVAGECGGESGVVDEFFALEEIEDFIGVAWRDSGFADFLADIRLALLRARAEVGHAQADSLGTQRFLGIRRR